MKFVRPTLPAGSPYAAGPVRLPASWRLLPSVLAALVLVFCAFPASGGGAEPHRAGGLLVAFRENASPAARAAALRRLGLVADGSFVSPYLARARPAPSSAAATRPLAETLSLGRRDPAVRLVEPDYPLQVSFVPNDPSFGFQYALQNLGQTGGFPGADVDAVRAWDLSTGSVSVVVAVIDTGVDTNHEDLKDNILRDDQGAVVGHDFVHDSPAVIDDNGHGTHVAGIIGALSDNGIGISGICPQVRIMPIKFSDQTGFGTAGSAIGAIDFAIAHGARIINASFGGPDFSQLLLEAVQRAESHGILFVAAAGNLGQNSDLFPQYPAAFSPRVSTMLSVAATDASDRLASFSNYGLSSVNLAAPGVDILSTTPGDTYSTFNGTSMAAPLVSGGAALLLAYRSKLTAVDLKTRLQNNVARLPSLAGRVSTGGRLSLRRVLQNGDDPPGTLLSLSLEPTSVTGGAPSTGTLVMSEAPPGGAVISLTSALPAAARVPAQLTVPEGTATVTFPIATSPTPETTLVGITARNGVSQQQAELDVLAAAPASVTVTPSPLPSGGSGTAMVTLSGPVPSAALLQVSTSPTRVLTTPATVNVPAGATRVTFPVQAARVKKPTAVTLTTTLYGFAARSNISIVPSMLRSLAVKPASVRRGHPAKATLALRYPAPPGGLPIALSASNAGAVQVPDGVTVPAGRSGTSFSVQTLQGKGRITATIFAAQGGNRKQARLAIRP